MIISHPADSINDAYFLAHLQIGKKSTSKIVMGQQSDNVVVSRQSKLSGNTTYTHNRFHIIVNLLHHPQCQGSGDINTSNYFWLSVVYRIYKNRKFRQHSCDSCAGKWHWKHQAGKQGKDQHCLLQNCYLHAGWNIPIIANRQARCTCKMSQLRHTIVRRKVRFCQNRHPISIIAVKACRK